MNGLVLIVSVRKRSSNIISQIPHACLVRQTINAWSSFVVLEPSFETTNLAEIRLQKVVVFCKYNRCHCGGLYSCATPPTISANAWQSVVTVMVMVGSGTENARDSNPKSN